MSNKPEMVAAIRLFQENRAGTIYIGFSIDFRDANDPTKIPTAWIESDARALMNIEWAGFVSDYGVASERHLIGWNEASCTAYHPHLRDLERAVKWIKKLDRAVEAWRKEYGALTLGKLATVIAKAVKAKHMVRWNHTDRCWQVYAVSADLVDRMVQEQETLARKAAA